MTSFVAPTSFETPDFPLRCYEPEDSAILPEATSASYDHLKSAMLALPTRCKGKSYAILKHEWQAGAGSSC